jgi:putative ATP-dependent endonuclease of the OLD family
MYLASLEIKNFRSIKELKVDFRQGLNVLVGRNNTGKTNLLHAIRHALGPSASRGEALWLDRDDFHRASATSEPEQHLSVSLVFKGMSDSQRAHFFEIIEFDLAVPDNSKALLRFEASWPKGKKFATIKRTGGPVAVESPEVPTRLLESLPVTFLPALRDAEAALAPGYRSRLALLLREMASRTGISTESRIVDIFKKANSELEGDKLVSDIASSLQRTTSLIAGTDHAPSTISAAEAEFEKILRTLQVQLKGTPIGSLTSNGLGFNNLLYMAVVLEHLKQDAVDESSLLLVEEPEAHLHPQLTVLLAEYLANTTPGASAPQTFVTTHSPTLVASVLPNQIQVLFTEAKDNKLRCNSVASAQMSESELGQLQRMIDVTRATLYFAKAVILVEGITEALLVPILAKLLGHDLSKEHISVIPICGVAFETFKKLLSSDVFGVPVSIISDADPRIIRGASWESDTAEVDGPNFKICDRIVKLHQLFKGHSSVKTWNSKITLEYDLAEAGNDNAMLMASVWESCFERCPGTLNTSRVTAAGSQTVDKALVVWRGICRADHSGSKAEFAHKLALKLSELHKSGAVASVFTVPDYIKNAIEHVVKSVALAPSSKLQP